MLPGKRLVEQFPPFVVGTPYSPTNKDVLFSHFMIIQTPKLQKLILFIVNLSVIEMPNQIA